jgi:hypothetical protein
MGIGQPCARVDFIPQSGTLDLASALAADELRFCPSVHGSFSSYIVYVGLIFRGQGFVDVHDLAPPVPSTNVCLS